MPLRLRPSQKGLTLIELIVGIALVALIVAMLVLVWRVVMNNRNTNERRVVASNIAYMVLDHETQKNFSTVASIVRTPVRSNEICATPDVDGLPPLTCNTLSGTANPYEDTDIPDLEFEVTVVCLQFNTTGAVNETTETNINLWEVDAVCSPPSGFKRMDVTIAGQALGTTPLQVRTLVTDIDGFQ